MPISKKINNIFWLSIKKKLRKHYIYLLLIIILIAGAFFRFYNLYDSYSLASDQGRDFLVVWRIINQRDLTALGPSLSNLGQVYLGPIYYYILAIWLPIFHFNPIGGRVLMVVFGLFTIILLFFFAKELFNKKIAILATLLYAVSCYTIVALRFAWNPNPIPFFALLTIFAFYRWYKYNKIFYFYLMVVSLVIILQLHILCLFLVPVLIILFIFLRPQKIHFKHYLFGFLIILFFFSSVIYFEINNHFLMTKQLVEFLKSPSNVSFFEGFKKNCYLFSTYINYMTNFMGIVFPFSKETNSLNIFYFSFTLILNLVSIFYLVFSALFNKYREGIIIVLIWWLVGMLGFVSFLHLQSPHYLHFMLPVIFLVPAIFLGSLLDKLELRWIAIVILLILVWINISKTWENINLHNNYGLRTMIKITRFVDDKSDNKKYSIWVPCPRLDASQSYFAPLKENVSPDIGWRYVFTVYGRKYNPESNNRFIILGPLCNSDLWLEQNRIFGLNEITIPEDFPKGLRIFENQKPNSLDS